MHADPSCPGTFVPARRHLASGGVEAVVMCDACFAEDPPLVQPIPRRRRCFWCGVIRRRVLWDRFCSPSCEAACAFYTTARKARSGA